MADHSMVFELYYGGAWHSAPVYVRDGCTLMRGVKAPGDSDPAAAAVTLDNRAGLYSPRSIVSPLHGLIGLNTQARITADGSVRLTGEAAKWMPSRAIVGDAWTKLEVAGLLQRIGRGTDPIQSAATRAGLALGPFAYWPLEAGAAAVTPDTLPLVPLVDAGTPPIAWADDDTLPGSLPLPQVYTETRSTPGPVLRTDSFPAAGAAAWSISVWIRQQPLQTAVIDSWRPFHWEPRPAGANQSWRLQVSSSPSVAFGYSLPTGAVANFPGKDVVDGRWHHIVMIAEQVGATISGALYVDGVAGTTLAATVDTLTALTSFEIFPQEIEIAAPGLDAWVGQLGFFGRALTAGEVQDLYQAGYGWVGETAADRFARICTEQDITPTVVGVAAESVAMGVQVPLPLLEIFDEIGRTDDASIFETRGSVGLTMRTGASKLNQTPDATVSYLGQITPDLEPVYGDEGVRNDVTAASPDGAVGRVQQLTGPRNVQLPGDDPDGVGRYTTRLEVNPETSDALAYAAGWRVGQGTFDGTWYARVTVDLDAAPAIAAAAAALDIGDVLALSNLPVDEALDVVESVIIGIEETVLPKRRLITFYLVPAAPYRVGILAATSGDTADFLGHLDTDGSTTVGAVAVGAASFSVATPTGPLWTVDADDFPFDVIVGGQRVSISSITGAASPQTFTVQPTGLRVAYPIPAGSAVNVHQPIIPTL